MKAEAWFIVQHMVRGRVKVPVICLSKYIQPRLVRGTSLAWDLQYSQHEMLLGLHRRLMHYEEPECDIFRLHMMPAYNLQDDTPVCMCNIRRNKCKMQ